MSLYGIKSTPPAVAPPPEPATNPLASHTYKKFLETVPDLGGPSARNCQSLWAAITAALAAEGYQSTLNPSEMHEGQAQLFRVAENFEGLFLRSGAPHHFDQFKEAVGTWSRSIVAGGKSPPREW